MLFSPHVLVIVYKSLGIETTLDNTYSSRGGKAHNAACVKRVGVFLPRVLCVLLVLVLEGCEAFVLNPSRVVSLYRCQLHVVLSVPGREHRRVAVGGLWPRGCSYNGSHGVAFLSRGGRCGSVFLPGFPLHLLNTQCYSFSVFSL